MRPCFRALGAAAALASATEVAADVELNERRLVQWVERGGVHDVVHSTFHRIDRWGAEGAGSWIYEWSAIAAFYADRAQASEASGDRAAARADYLSASLYYAIARFPDNRSPEQRAAYDKHLEYYQAAGQYFDPPLEVVTIPFRDDEVTGYLHLPRAAERPPLIIWANGIDTHKGDIYARLQPFLARGVAVLTVDTIGTGENTTWPAEPGGEAMLQAVVEAMRADARIDGARIGHVGISFGGYFAARLAVAEPHLKAVAALCAPVESIFTQEAEVFANPAMLEVSDAMAAAVHVEARDFAALSEKARTFNLREAGLVGGDPTIAMPLLVANGDLDPLVPVSDMRLLAAAGEDSDMWIMGGTGHCAGDYGEAFYTNVAEWFLERL